MRRIPFSLSFCMATALTLAWGVLAGVVYREELSNQTWGILVSAVLPCILIPIAWRHVRRFRVGKHRCPRCGYDLTGNVSGRCPECGTQIDLNTNDDTVRSPDG